jgi:hypothetical protein
MFTKQDSPGKIAIDSCLISTVEETSDGSVITYTIENDTETVYIKETIEEIIKKVNG